MTSNEVPATPGPVSVLAAGEPALKYGPSVTPGVATLEQAIGAGVEAWGLGEVAGKGEEARGTAAEVPVPAQPVIAATR